MPLAGILIGLEGSGVRAVLPRLLGSRTMS
jgi:hypothetical protein